MDEIKFVFKCLLAACMIFALSQYRLDNGVTIEASVRGYLVSSSVAGFVNESARGGVKLVKKLTDEVKVYLGQEKAEVKPRPIYSSTIHKKETSQIESDDIDLE
jgi:hypothetical protein